MKKFKLQSAKAPDLSRTEPAKPKVALKDEASEKERRREQMEKEMKMLEGKITQKEGTIKESSKLLDIDEFLKKQKEKTREYALRLNDEYEKQKKEREVKLYKKYNRGEQGSEKLITSTSKNQIPLNVFSAIDQLKQVEGSSKQWILDDHHYKLDDLLLDTAKGHLFGQPLKEQEEKDLKTQQQNSWKRMKEVSQHSAEIKYLPVELEENQLQPSDFGEALMSALTLMPKQTSEYLYEQRRGVDQQQYFLCRFYPGGQRRSVITNEWIEVREYTHKYINMSSRHKNGTSFWSTLLEKCYKKLYCSQPAPTSLRETIQILYGLDPEIIPFSNLATIKQNVAKVLNTLLSCSPRARVGFINDRTSTGDRIYPLLGLQLPVEKRKKKKGPSEEEKQQVLYSISNPYTGILKSDFTSKFTMNQLFEKFNKLIVLREFPEKWSAVRVKIDFLSNGPISFTNSEWVKNNQYSFTLSKPADICLLLRRSWGTFIEAADRQEEEKLIYGFILFRSGEGETEVSSMKLENLLAKCKSSDEKGCSFNQPLDKGTYILVPFSHYVSQQYTQSFNLDILLEKPEALTINKAKIYDYYYENKPSSDLKVIQKLQSRVKYQRPKTEKVSLPKMGNHANKSINEKVVEGLGLTVKSELRLADFLIPGRLRPFLVQGEVKEEKKGKREAKSSQEQQLDKYEREEALKILLGYDALLDSQVSHGEMMAVVNETADEIDLADYGLGEEGLMAVMETLMSLPRITKLNLANNALNDSAITYLCYYLEKGSRNELRSLDVSGNNLGKSSVRALRGLSGLFSKLSIVGVKL